MTEVILVLCAGVFTGFLLRKKTRLLHGAEKAATVTVFVLLLLLGMSIGSNGAVLSTLPRLGARAAVISLAGVTGSVALSTLVSKHLFPKERGHED
jgi:uncharacterized membrane protein YbjE (DUF340 family)